jgi:hypothetical protein
MEDIYISRFPVLLGIIQSKSQLDRYIFRIYIPNYEK